MQLLPQKSSDNNDIFIFVNISLRRCSVFFFYQVIISGEKDLSNAPNRRIGAEASIIEERGIPPKVPYGSTKG